MKKQQMQQLKRMYRGASYLLLLVAGTVYFLRRRSADEGLPNFELCRTAVRINERLKRGYWRHRIWPKENPNPKPSLDAVMSRRSRKEVEELSC